MGAEQFTVRAEGPDVATAFQATVEQARYDYGHAGYTGTIAEKDSFTLYELPPGVSVEEFIRAADIASWRGGALPEWAQQWPDFESAANTYDDKWGPAVAFQIDTSHFVFTGWASS